MDLGIFDHLDRREAPLDEFYESRLRLLEKYDAAGFYSYHLAEHHATPLGLAPVPGIFLAAATQRTRRIRLGPCVYCLPLYDPLRLIEEICMLDQLSRGRFELGVGRGIVPYEMAYFNLHHLETEEIYRETLEVILRGLTGDVLAVKSALGIRRERAGGDWPLYPACLTVQAMDGRFVTASSTSCCSPVCRGSWEWRGSGSRPSGTRSRGPP